MSEQYSDDEGSCFNTKSPIRRSEEVNKILNAWVKRKSGNGYLLG